LKAPAIRAGGEEGVRAGLFQSGAKWASGAASDLP
jgi:hypothetical protein